MRELDCIESKARDRRLQAKFGVMLACEARPMRDGGSLEHFMSTLQVSSLLFEKGGAWELATRTPLSALPHSPLSSSASSSDRCRRRQVFI